MFFTSSRQECHDPETAVAALQALLAATAATVKHNIKTR